MYSASYMHEGEVCEAEKRSNDIIWLRFKANHFIQDFDPVPYAHHMHHILKPSTDSISTDFLHITKLAVLFLLFTRQIIID